VSDASDVLSSFLHREFPGLTLSAATARPAKWPSLRFELGGDVPNDASEERIEQATDRAAAIFEAAFSPDDQGFFSFTRWRPDDDPLVLALLPDGSEPSREEGHDFYNQGDQTRYVTHTATLRPRSLNYRSLFELVASSELGRSPAIDGRAYIINASNPLVFHMYDDRGAILLGTTEHALKDLRRQFEDWVIP
jgi:hypothetical protein